MTNPAETLIEMGAPNNIYTRTIYRVIHRLACIILYAGITVTSIVTRKNKLELLNTLNVKLGADPIDPIE